MTEAEREKMKTYEGLDYDIVENRLFKTRKAMQSASDKKVESIWNWGIYLAVGLVTALTSFVIAVCVEELASLKFEVVRSLIGAEASYVSGFISFAAFNVGFVAIAAAMVCFVEPASGGSGIPELKAYLNGTNMVQLLHPKTLLCKVVGVLFSVAGGLTIGKEGPLVHTGAVLGANFSHLPKLPKLLGRPALKRWRNDHDKRDYVSGGAASGVAAAFGAPVGGVLFTLEEAASFWSIPLTWRVFFAAAVSTFTLNLCLSARDGNVLSVNSPGLITFGKFTTNTYSLWEVPLFLLLGVMGGVFGGLFCKLNVFLCRLRRDYLLQRPALRFLEALAIALLTSALFFCAPFLAQSCHPVASNATDIHGVLFASYNRFGCPVGTYNEMAALSFTTQEKAILSFFHSTSTFTPTVLITYMFLYMFLAVITYGIAVPSGLFVPCILSGCAYGRLVGELLRYWLGPGLIDPGTYALIGATSMLGGVARMTISLSVILVETTNEINYILPIMLTLTVAKWVGDCFTISLYDLHVELKSIPFVESHVPDALDRFTAGDVMSRPVLSLPRRSSVGHVLDTLKDCGHNGFPVLDSNRCLRGLILRNQLLVLLQHKIYAPAAAAAAPTNTTAAEATAAANAAAAGESKEGNRGDGGDGDNDSGGRDRFDSAESSAWGRELGFSVEAAAAVKEAVCDLTDFGVTLQSKVLTLRAMADGIQPEERGHLLDLLPYMNPVPFSVQRETPLSRVYRLYAGMGIRHLPVVDARNKVVGMLTRQELHSDFSQDLF